MASGESPSVGVGTHPATDLTREGGRLPWGDSGATARAAAGLERASQPESELGSGAGSALSGRSEGFGLTIDDPLDLAPGSDIGGATILRLLGEGGMGRVYEARQTAPDRPVAVKVLRDAIASREQLARFTYEAEVLGRLRHPGIALIHASGTFLHGPITVPFFIMELVADARPITAYARERGLGLTARVAVFRAVCDAVAHGHRKGVVHRDLKPANILVDAAGDPKVIDFGVARSTALDAVRSGLGTVAGQLVGTLAYMSPEQLDGRADDVDSRSDVYALGLVLHELIVGELPQDRLGGSLIEAARASQEGGARALSNVERAARAAGCSRAAARPLAAVVGRCLAPDAGDRYATAGDVAAELDRWGSGEPVLARPLTSLETLTRIVRRHRVAAAAVAVAATALVAAVAASSRFALDAARQAAAARAELYTANVLLAAEARDRDALPEAQRRLDAARALAAESGRRQPVELGCIAATLDDSVVVATRHAAAVLATALAPDGRRLATGARDGSARIVAVADGQDADAGPIELVGHDDEVWRVAWSPDGTRVATASADKTARIWDAATGRELLRIDAHRATVYGLDFSRDGTVLATSGADDTARLWDVSLGTELGRLEGHAATVYSVSLSADGRRAVTASRDKTVKIWDVDRREPLHTLEGHEDWVFNATLAPDETRIASASKDGTVRLWRVIDGKVQTTIRHPFRVSAVAFTADGRHVVTASHDGVLRMFTASRGKEIWRGRGHAAAIWTVTAVAGGGLAATGSEDGTARLWSTDGTCIPVVQATQPVWTVGFSPDGARLAVGGEGATVQVFDARTLLPQCQVSAATEGVREVGFIEGGTTLAAACNDGSVRLWSMDDDRPERLIRCHDRWIYSVAFSAEGSRMATASEDRTVAIRDLARPDAAPRILKHRKRCLCVRFSPDGRRLYGGFEDGIARAYDAATGEQISDFTRHQAAVNWIAPSLDGALLATASSDGTVGIWRAADAVLLRRLEGPSRQVWKVALSSDASRAAAVSADGAVHLWDVVSGRPLPVLRGHADEAWALAFAADGRTLASGSWDKTVRIHGVSAAELFRAKRGRSSFRPDTSHAP